MLNILRSIPWAFRITLRAAGEHVALHHNEGARECRRASETQYYPGTGES